MAKKEHVDLLKQGISAWNEWREKNPDIQPDLSWGTLSGLDMRGANLEGANLKLAFCRKANLEGANLKGANLYGTNLEDAILKGANLEGANLEGAHLMRSDLSKTSLEGASLKMANLDGACLSEANLKGIKKLTLEQLLKVKTLRVAELDPALMAQVREKSPFLLEEPESDE